LVIAFPGSRGTASLVDQARRLSRRSAIPIEVIEIAAAHSRLRWGFARSPEPRLSTH
jgi:hypothetical protein